MLRPEYTPGLLTRFWAKVNKTETCWLWTGAAHNGYGRLSSWRGGPSFAAHQMAYEMVGGMLPDGLLACHTCDVKLCVRNDIPEYHEVDGVLIPRWGHLFAGTPLQNMRDMVAKGRSLRGDRHPMIAKPESRLRGDEHWTRTQPQRMPRGDDHHARRQPERLARGERVGNAALTSQQVIQIRRLAETEAIPHRKLALLFGVTKSTVTRVLSGKCWAHVT